MFSNFKIGRTVFIHGFGYFVPPIIMLAMWYPNRTTDEEKRILLTEKFGEEKVRLAQANQKDMQQFFDKVKAGDKGINDQLESVLQRGKRSEVQTWAAEKANPSSVPIIRSQGDVGMVETPPLPKRKPESTRVEAT